MKNYHVLDIIAVILLLAGGLNWGFVGLFNYNLVSVIFGVTISHIIFALVGIAALYRIIMMIRTKKPV